MQVLPTSMSVPTRIAQSDCVFSHMLVGLCKENGEGVENGGGGNVGKGVRGGGYYVSSLSVSLSVRPSLSLAAFIRERS